MLLLLGAHLNSAAILLLLVVVALGLHLIPACACGDVQHCPVLCAVDAVTLEHGLNLALQVSSCCKLQQLLRTGNSATDKQWYMQ
jgi:hypothetical protein